ncbi:MAG: hypothetical protein Q7S16_02315 [bacterium]|nr:hypothetical protein [bacterium]
MYKYIFTVILFFFLPLLTHAAYDADFQRGYNFPSWWFDSYSQSWSDDSFKELLTHKPGWIAVEPFWYQKDKYATTIYPNAKRTANDAGVEHVIQMAHASGVKVMLKPFVDAEGGDWRGTFKPKDTNAWFASYTAMAVHYAKMAQRLNVESYLIGAEYVTLSGSQYSQKWRDVATAVRQNYSGQIGYGANWDNQKGTSEFALIDWWDAVDFIGIHAYFPIAKTNDATQTEMLKELEPWVLRVQATQEKYKKPVIFTEAGYKSCDGGTRIPWWCNPKAGVDLQEQSDGTEAILRAFQDKPWFKGIFWWMWNIKPSSGGVKDKDHNMNRKPVMDVIKKYWNASATAMAGQAISGPVPILPPLPPIIILPKQPIVAPTQKPEKKETEFIYGIARKSPAGEKVAEKKMWNAVGKSFGWRQPKLKPGEWTIALRAYMYGGYPINVVRDFLHHKKGVIINPTISWKELKK